MEKENIKTPPAQPGYTIYIFICSFLPQTKNLGTRLLHQLHFDPRHTTDDGKVSCN